MANRPTINDIARLAGVSKATVSRVMNHKPDVDPVTRERVLRIVEEQKFVPSLAAAGLAGGQSHLLGVLVPSFTWPFIPEIMRGVAEVVGQTSYELVLYSINDSLRENDKSDIIDHILATKLISGLLAIVPGQSSKYIKRLHTYGMPVVMLDDQEQPTDVPWIGTDNLRGAYLAARHLVQLGHRRIAHIQGPMKYLCSRERYLGYCQALQEGGLTPDPQIVLEGDFMPQGGRIAANKLLALPPEQRPTAIFAANDYTAYGVMAVAEEHGIHIPSDIALVGFDDLTGSAHMRPALTTVRQPFYEMGQQATELLLSMLEKPRFSRPIPGRWSEASSSSGTTGNGAGPHDVHKFIRIQLTTTLVVRTSCGSPDTSPVSKTEVPYRNVLRQ